jgi:hypothetical protein
MPQTVRRLLLLAAVATLVAACGPSWQEVSTPDGGFRILMRGDPRIEKRDVDTPIGKITGNWYATELQESVFGVGYSDYPTQIVSGMAPQEMFTTVRESWVKRINGKLQGDGTDIRLEKAHPGMEFIARGQLKGHDVYLRGRLYLVGNRLYQVIVFGRRDTLPLSDVNTYLDSFKLVPQHDVATVGVDGKAEGGRRKEEGKIDTPKTK